MNISRHCLNKNMIITALSLIPCHILASECPQKSRDQIFAEAFNSQKKRVMDLPAYTAAHNRFMQFLNEIEQHKARKIKEMQEDQEYQKNFTEIKREIQRSGELCKQNNNLSNAECEHLVASLAKQFIPT